MRAALGPRHRGVYGDIAAYPIDLNIKEGAVFGHIRVIERLVTMFFFSTYGENFGRGASSIISWCEKLLFLDTLDR